MTLTSSANQGSQRALSGQTKRLIGAAFALLVTSATLALLGPVIPTHAAGRPAESAAPDLNTPPKATKVAESAAPTWKDLTAFQQHVLAPLASDWDKLKPTTRKKWLEISGRYTSMTPAEQERLQARMRGWVTLTPEQRRIARENYARANKLDTEKRALRWQQYQQLSEQQKKELAEQATPRHKRVTTMPPATLNKNKPATPAQLAPPAAGPAAVAAEQTAATVPASAPSGSPAVK
ncbi:DUF3106 domain-containing protein [Collimonas sp.]|jgi:hypothetical protein|uniref:DUF3106 domain-containing protein n=1 Tax=Collimonas sp. TaxID=1963772 RepID=UPI0037BE5968